MNFLQRRSISRRRLLQGAASGFAASVALPTLEGMLNGNGTALADGSALPMRFGTWYFGGGLLGGNANFAPVEEYRPLFTTVSGVTMRHETFTHRAHNMLAASGTWSHPPVKGQRELLVPTKPSFDIVGAQLWAGHAKVDSMQIAAHDTGPYTSSFRIPYQKSKMETDPEVVFNSIFGAGDAVVGGSTPAASAQVTEARKSILDLVRGDIAAMKNEVGVADRSRLEAYFEGLRGVEQILAARKAPGGAAVPAAPGCMKPAGPGVYEASGEKWDFEGRNRVMTDLLALALVCDVTRVFAFQFTRGQSNAIFWPVGVTQEHHSATHTAKDAAAKATTYVLKQLGYFMKKMSTTPDGAGTLHDNMLTFVTSEFSGNHGNTNHPILVYGKAGGRVKVGQRLAGNCDLSNAHLGVMQAAGFPLTNWGANNAHIQTYTEKAYTGFMA